MNPVGLFIINAGITQLSPMLDYRPEMSIRPGAVHSMTERCLANQGRFNHQLLEWAPSFNNVKRAGVEGTGHTGQGRSSRIE